ncbi:OLC1v1018887C1 [Oldenlandia corymbosa var. corymbosa]|uniref:OLC1v1018887C1 n=1 Tax=Oldenlandia corymbosa var. corymbosa TaxID=529605 RepID=A0AAV1ECN1_OLDCO|nr:OLC1v1018887C1 [Oldenlandia corymbosa var. corymbosa]
MYDGSSDPDDHLNVYNSVMNLFTYPMPVWCKLYPVMLRDQARLWFDNLASGSIHSWTQLEEAFRLHFLPQKKFQKAREELFTIKQRDQETPRAYVERFAKERTNRISVLHGIHGESSKYKRANKYARGEEANWKCRDESQSARRPEAKSRGPSVYQIVTPKIPRRHQEFPKPYPSEQNTQGDPADCFRERHSEATSEDEQNGQLAKFALEAQKGDMNSQKKDRATDASRKVRRGQYNWNINCDGEKPNREVNQVVTRDILSIIGGLAVGDPESQRKLDVGRFRMEMPTTEDLNLLKQSLSSMRTLFRNVM